ncbi:winged helix-turn-helix transcriptional regulator [Priestia filamentosa]|uniref:ArsR/SmtB family transcription factor n=1 Tax=Priestia filamentosa TaxID=1402861 RepID=UPI001FB444CF|nr:metalloregulator ArsR/SmtB family transcription factor [Priestia filamentosa]MED3729252.1 metalloregulator ArsR/SmtB family transcription factor [Priestia filamentosa]UOE59135.1 winged helix-turn-helix transcriptional regulator [Priestia filamentosa]
MSVSQQKHDVFQAIADPTRREVLRLLAEKELPISEITSHFPISRTAIAKHLRILSEAELVSGRKVGREKIYRLHPEPLTELKQWLAFYEKFWENKLSMLKHIVEVPEENSLKLMKSETAEDQES